VLRIYHQFNNRVEEIEADDTLDYDKEKLILVSYTCKQLIREDGSRVVESKRDHSDQVTLTDLQI